MDLRKCLRAILTNLHPCMVGKCALQQERDVYVQEKLPSATQLFSRDAERKEQND